MVLSAPASACSSLRPPASITSYVILINSAIKSVMLWFIFYLVIRTMVGRPLGQIRDYLARMDADSLGVVADLAERPAHHGADHQVEDEPEHDRLDRRVDQPLVIEAGGRNELHALAGALNTMRDRLRWSFEENGSGRAAGPPWCGSPGRR
jgi:HAMP domain-containing protein